MNPMPIAYVKFQRSSQPVLFVSAMGHISPPTMTADASRTERRPKRSDR